MKAIMLMFDSLNRHMLEPYGCDWVKTPNLKRLAKRAVTFDTCYVGSLPCMPARRELHTGRYNFLHRSWGPLEPFDDSMPQLLKDAGVYTHLISDHSHYWEEGGATYHQRYNTWEQVRGQEGDCWKPSVKPPEKPPHYGKCWLQDEVNRQFLQTEEDMPLHQVYDLGLEFLQNNFSEDNWFLQIESFDPHEPFYVPEQFKAMYPDNYAGPRFDWPAYQKVTEPVEAVEHCRNQYAALVSQCDYHIGRILDFMDVHNMWQDTMLIINTDHGFLLGEHDWWAKGVMPLYEEISHTPLFIWDPRAKAEGVRRKALVQTIDLAPTLLEYFNLPLPKDMLGQPLAETIKTDKPVRQYGLFGMFGRQINITDGRYVYMRTPRSTSEPLCEYTLMPTHMHSFFSDEELKTVQLDNSLSFTKELPVMKVKVGEVTNVNGQIAEDCYRDFLFDLHNDPNQLRPITDRMLESQLQQEMVSLMKINGTPDGQLARMGFD